MERENKVSVWIGKFNDKNDFQEYLEISYDDNGEMLSNFMKDFNIEFYDEDFSESIFLESSSLSELKNFSYSNSFVENVLGKALDYNSFFVLYDFDFDSNDNISGKLKFIGSFDYSKD